MSFELIYTSVPKGLTPNSSGFCTAAATAGISRAVWMKLEALSAYEFLFQLSDPKAQLNPVNFAHTTVAIGSQRQSVLSRVAFCGADYSGRANKIAHHVLLGPTDPTPAGPAAMMLQMREGFFSQRWDRGPTEMPSRSLAQTLGQTAVEPAPCAYWQQTAGDSGWGGMLTKAIADNSRVPAYVMYEPGTDVLRLFAESLALLPADARWRVDFATYYTALPAGCFYHWRAVAAGSAAAREAARFPNATVIDLTRPLAAAPDNTHTAAARAGRAAARAAPAQVETAPPAAVAEPSASAVAAAPAAAPAPAEDIYELDALTAAAPGQPRRAAIVTRPPRKPWTAVLGVLVALLLITNIVTLSLWLDQRPTPPEELPADSIEATGPADAGPDQPLPPTKPIDDDSIDTVPSQDPLTDKGQPTGTKAPPEDSAGKPDDATTSADDADTAADAGPTEPTDDGPDEQGASDDQEGDGSSSTDEGTNGSATAAQPDPPQPITTTVKRDAVAGFATKVVHPDHTDPPREENDLSPYVFSVPDASCLIRSFPPRVGSATALYLEPARAAEPGMIRAEDKDGFELGSYRLETPGALTLTLTRKGARPHYGLKYLVMEIADQKGQILYLCRIVPPHKTEPATVGFNAKLQTLNARRAADQRESDTSRIGVPVPITILTNYPNRWLRSVHLAGASKTAHAKLAGIEAIFARDDPIQYVVIDEDTLELELTRGKDDAPPTARLLCPALQTVPKDAQRLALGEYFLGLKIALDILDTSLGRIETIANSLDIKEGNAKLASIGKEMKKAVEDNVKDLPEATRRIVAGHVRDNLQIDALIARFEGTPRKKKWLTTIKAIKRDKKPLKKLRDDLSSAGNAKLIPDKDRNRKKVIADIARIKARVNGLGEIQIVDGWGVPLASIKPRFEMPADTVEQLFDRLADLEGQLRAYRE
ncbi:MAG: GAP1-N2 domain-containing protein [Planctomycetota bacterium]